MIRYRFDPATAIRRYALSMSSRASRPGAEDAGGGPAFVAVRFDIGPGVGADVVHDGPA
jgi:hypothetical protein